MHAYPCCGILSFWSNRLAPREDMCHVNATAHVNNNATAQSNKATARTVIGTRQHITSIASSSTSSSACLLTLQLRIMNYKTEEKRKRKAKFALIYDNDSVAEETFCLHGVAGLWLRVSRRHQSSSPESTDNTIRPSIGFMQLGVKRLQSPQGLATDRPHHASAEAVAGCARRVETSRAVSRVSLTRYRLSQRRYGVVDNNGDFSTVRRDGGACPDSLHSTDRQRLKHCPAPRYGKFGVRQ